jgi:hypothetical protein
MSINRTAYSSTMPKIVPISYVVVYGRERLTKFIHVVLITISRG